MCAILDANVAHEVFGGDRPEAGGKFFDWISSGTGRLVVGGRLLAELDQTVARTWLREAFRAGRIRREDDNEVEIAEHSLRGICRSNDPHIIALGQVSGARLLYSNDRELQTDFKNKSLIDQPRGKIYSTRRTKSYGTSHQGLLRSTNLCRAGS